MTGQQNEGGSVKDILRLVVISSGSTTGVGWAARVYDPTTVPKGLMVAMTIICVVSCAAAMAVELWRTVVTTRGEERRKDHEAGLLPRTGWRWRRDQRHGLTAVRADRTDPADHADPAAQPSSGPNSPSAAGPARSRPGQR